MNNILIIATLDDELLIPFKKLKNKIDFTNKSVTILHVVQKEILSVDLATYEWPNANEFKEIRGHVLKKLDQMKPHIFGDQKPKEITLEVILDTSAKDTILEEAKKFKADLLVMSTRGKKGFEGLFSSSMAEFLIKYSPCDLLVLRPN